MAGKFGKTEFMCNMTYYGNTCEIPRGYLYVNYWTVSWLGAMLSEYKYHTNLQKNILDVYRYKLLFTVTLLAVPQKAS